MTDTANQVAQQANAPQTTALQFLTFTLGEEKYGLDIQNIQELRSYKSIIGISDTPAFIKGVINLHDATVPIIDMRVKLLGTPTYDHFTTVIILNLDRRMIGMVVDNVLDVITLTPEQIKPASEVPSSLGADCVIGIATVEEKVLILVDVTALISSAELASIEKVRCVAKIIRLHALYKGKYK